MYKRKGYTYMLNSNNLSSCSLNGLVDDPEAATCIMSAGTKEDHYDVVSGSWKKLKVLRTYCRAPQALGTAMPHLLPPWWLNSKARAVGRRRNFGGSKDMELHWLQEIDVNNAAGSADPIDPDNRT